MLTPKPQEALLLASAATNHTLHRCRGGWFNRSCNPAAQASEVVTTRTANTLVDMGLAEYDDAMLPSALTLTSHGATEAARIIGAKQAA